MRRITGKAKGANRAIMDKLKFNNLRMYNENFPHTWTHKIVAPLLLLFGLGLLFWKGYNWLLLKIQEPIAILTFIGGLVGAFILKIVLDIYEQPILKIETWGDNNGETCKWRCGSHIHYKIKVANASPFFAKKCQIKITLKFEKEDIEKYDKSLMRAKDPEDKAPFIKNEKEYSRVESEHILWDVEPHGKEAFEIDIPPKSSYFSTVARYYLNDDYKDEGHRKLGQELFGDYFQIKSENPKTPRVYLKSDKEYLCRIQIFGENFYPLTKEVKLLYRE